jgi:hypothetical protein
MRRAKREFSSYALLDCATLQAQDDSDKINSNMGAAVSFPLNPTSKFVKTSWGLVRGAGSSVAYLQVCGRLPSTCNHGLGLWASMPFERGSVAAWACRVPRISGRATGIVISPCWALDLASRVGLGGSVEEMPRRGY